MDEDYMNMIGQKFLQLDSHLTTWCIIERFKRMYHISDSTKINCYDLVESFFQINLKKREVQITNVLFKDFIYSHPYCNTLRFCPICIAEGIHLHEHQSYVWATCIVHPEQMLKTECPNCYKKIKLYKNRYLKIFLPFTCECGYCFLKYDDLDVLLNFWNLKLPNGNQTSYYIRESPIFPLACSQVSRKALLKLYTGEFKFNSHHRKKHYKRFYKYKSRLLKTELETITASFHNFLSQLLGCKLFSEETICIFLKKYLLIKDCSELFNNEIEYYLAQRKEERYRKNNYFPRNEELSNIYYQFVSILYMTSGECESVNILAKNWVIYHFIQYLCSETIRQLVENDDLQQPFLYKFYPSDEKDYFYAEVTYQSIFQKTIL